MRMELLLSLRVTSILDHKNTHNNGWHKLLTLRDQAVLEQMN